MGDPFKDAITELFSASEAITGVGFTDLDGEDIAVTPRAEREALRMCAAYGGIALRRLSGTEKRAGRGPIKHITLTGQTGAFVTLAVGEEYQLVVTVADGAHPGQVAFEAQKAVDTLVQNI